MLAERGGERPSTETMMNAEANPAGDLDSKVGREAQIVMEARGLKKTYGAGARDRKSVV